MSKLVVIESHTGSECPDCEADTFEDHQFDDHVGEIICSSCQIEFDYTKNFQYSPDNPHTNIQLVSTLLVQKDN